MSGKNICLEKYEIGKKYRAKNPTNPSRHVAYKIKEVKSRSLHRFGAMLADVAGCGRCHGPHEFKFGGCHCAQYYQPLDSWPENISEVLGRDVVAVFPGLVRDGLRQSEINYLVELSNREIPGILAKGESARLKAKSYLVSELKDLRNNKGELLEFNHAVELYLDQAISWITNHEE